MQYVKVKPASHSKSKAPVDASKEKISAKKINGALHASIKNATAKEFVLLKNISGYTNEDLAALVGITHRTIRNKNSNDEIFNIAQTERLRKLNFMFTEGNEVFGNKDEFHAWLQQPAYGLDYNTPGKLLKQPGGLDKVLNEINGIKYGDTV